MTDRDAEWLRLHLTPGLGRKSLRELVTRYGSPAAALAESRNWQQLGLRSHLAAAVPAADDRLFLTVLDQLDKNQVRLVAFCDEAFPSLLAAIPDPPALLYLRGDLPPQDAFAIVGSRRATPTGLRLTREIAGELASRGIAIVSGLARGIDTAAHTGALDAAGPTVAVLGCGIDRIYPPENARLFQRILEGHGAIISEYSPGTPPLAGNFPGRNRLISGLCQGVLIVEAAEESGSLITADFALEQGRDVFAVPAGVASPVGGGVNRLLKQGAFLVTESADILERLWPALPPAQQQKEEARLEGELDGDARRVYAELGDEPLYIDDLARKTALTPPLLSAILLDLELRGGALQLPGSRYIRNRRP